MIIRCTAVRHSSHLDAKVCRISQSSINMKTYQSLWYCRLTRITLASTALSVYCLITTSDIETKFDKESTDERKCVNLTLKISVNSCYETLKQ